MSDNESADRRRPHHRVRRPLSKKNERPSSVENHAFEPIEDVPVPPPMADAVADGPPKQKKRPRRTYEPESDDDMPAIEQPQQRTTTLPPHNTWNSLFNGPPKVPPYMTNEELGQWQTGLLNSKDKHIAYVEKLTKQSTEEAAGFSGMLFDMHAGFTKFEWQVKGTKDSARKWPMPTTHLQEPWKRFSGLILEKIDWAAETLDSRNAEIIALKEQLKQKNEMSIQLQARNDRIAALEAQIAEQKDENKRHSAEQDMEIANLRAKIESQAELQDKLAASQSENRKQAAKILQLQTESQKTDTADEEPSTDLRTSEGRVAKEKSVYPLGLGTPSDVELSTGLRTSEKRIAKEMSMCPPGLRTPSAGDVERRVEAEDLCQRLTTELGFLHRSMSGLKTAYKHNIDTQSFTTTGGWSAFEGVTGRNTQEGRGGIESKQSHSVQRRHGKVSGPRR